MWIDGITPTGKSLSTKAKICPQNRSLLMIDYSVSKRMKYTVRENSLMMMLTHGRQKKQVSKDNTEPLDQPPLKFKQSPDLTNLTSSLNSYKVKKKEKNEIDSLYWRQASINLFTSTFIGPNSCKSFMVVLTLLTTVISNTHTHYRSE